ncbi:MAG TPA: hypothetical protein VF649_03950 [Sphingomonas sp.]|jgi:hypothetical protein
MDYRSDLSGGTPIRHPLLKARAYHDRAGSRNADDIGAPALASGIQPA